MLTALSAADLARRLRAREISAREVAEAHLERIEAVDAQVGAYLTVDREYTLGQADAAQQLLDKGEGGPLTGVPVALKDNMSTAGVETNCASKILQGYIPPYDADVVERLKAAGVVILGKTNLDEFAMGTSCENSAIKLTHNPWDLSRTPGGSSGGSAAAVAADLAPISLGSDTGGSIRLPASLCGVVGFKPTYGRCSRYGLVAFGSSLDQIGPFGRSVEDAALLASATCGHDFRDSTSRPDAAFRPLDFAGASLKGKKLGVISELADEGLQPGVAAVFASTLKMLAAEGAEIEHVSLPALAHGVTTYYIIAPAEASSNLARFDGIRYGPRLQGTGHVGLVEKTRSLFGREVKSRIMIGTYALSAGYYDAFYLKAQTVRALMTAEMNEAFTKFDFLVSPTSPVVAFKLGEFADDPLALKLLDLCTIPANMAGIPGISLNAGFSEGLPVGLQLMAPQMGDENLLLAAHAAERAMPEAQRRPSLP
jgi:aspartyl-tRNA(Asn)/glutamyl-tRNA(Gln) amidotransferase subunit A